MPRAVVGAFFAASILPLAACRSATAPTRAATATAALFTDGMVDIGSGRSLHVHCMGNGEPLVVMDAGMGGSGTVWQFVQPEIAQTTRVCVYDRAGAGYSDTPSKPRTVPQIVHELHALLATTKLPGPRVLVGHSMGGLYMRLYAAEFAEEVAGMVLVDASTEDQDVRMWSLYPADALKENPRDREGVTFQAQRAAMAQLRSANRSLGDKPLIVLTAGHDEPDPGVPPDVAARINHVWQEMQAELPNISSNGAQVVATKSTHFIQFDSPKLVIAAVREVVGSVREHRHVDATPLRAIASE
jgi:pimeloyl-ACP methyl ester carboxylesterase